jgi:hypothetical protein
MHVCSNCLSNYVSSASNLSDLSTVRTFVLLVTLLDELSRHELRPATAKRKKYSVTGLPKNIFFDDGHADRNM